METCQTILSVEQCKDLLRLIGKKHCVPARLISMLLLSEEDKNDMLLGNVPVEMLECAVKVWMSNGMPDYAHGLTEHTRRILITNYG